MLKTKIAIFTANGQDLIVVPLDGSFNDKFPSERVKALKTLKDAATKAGLTAPIAIVWRAGSKLHFIAPDGWNAFMERLSWSTIVSHLCAVLSFPIETDQCYGKHSVEVIWSDSASKSRLAHTLRIISTPDSARNSATALH